ncbi:CvpA family protein [Alkalibacterium sp. 20]|uniref:CvpA family protein n=1 Tax=Alkalibacterium sp. 20 TaxID=1798803 RepID=UPI000900394C|nr:CvpA family protein [Alkalibacterium sp. 20]OJF95334.1 colicin V production protein CvpA [Alkalibacterium sp. 20]
MLLTGIIIFLLLLSLYSGARRGLVLQLVLTIGYVVSFWFALNYYQMLNEYAQMFIPYPTPVTTSDNPFVLYSIDFLFDLDGAFYKGVSFVILLFVGWLVTRILGGLFQSLADLPVVRTVNAIGGAALSFVVHYIGIFFVLFVLSMLPVALIQNQFASSALAREIVTDTPALSEQVYDWWIEQGPQE